MCGNAAPNIHSSQAAAPRATGLLSPWHYWCREGAGRRPIATAAREQHVDAAESRRIFGVCKWRAGNVQATKEILLKSDCKFCPCWTEAVAAIVFGKPCNSAALLTASCKVDRHAVNRTSCSG